MAHSSFDFPIVCGLNEYFSVFLPTRGVFIADLYVHLYVQDVLTSCYVVLNIARF